MARVAIIADVHGNVPALEAALADVAAQGVEAVVFGGDLVGRGPQGSAVVGRVRAGGWASVRGNHEDYLLSFRRRAVPIDWLSAPVWAASRWMAEELSDEDAAWIDGLPLALTLGAAPGLHVVHGSPLSHSEGLGPWCDDEALAAHLARVEGDLLVCAHTHRPLDREVAGGRVVNVGSVGLPFNGDRRAQYAIFERRGDGGWEVEARAVAYDLGRTLAIYEATGFLSEGGITARLLALELEHARPFLVPFLEWAEARGEAPGVEALAAFRAFHDPEEATSRFRERLAALS